MTSGPTEQLFPLGVPESTAMTGPAVEVYYDPFDHAIDDDPYRCGERMRAEAPLYYNDSNKFYALSRYDDVAAALPDWQTYRSGRGTTPTSRSAGHRGATRHPAVRGSGPCDLHRRLLSRVFARAACWPSRTWCANTVAQRIGSTAR